MSNKQATAFLLTLSSLVLASCGAGAPEPAKVQADSFPVVLESVGIAPVADSYEAVGTVRARTTSVLSSKVMGQVLSVRVQPGQSVSRGQLLAEIDSRDAVVSLAKAKAGLSEAQNALVEVEESTRAAEAAKESAEAAAALATSTYRRYQALLQRQSVSQQEFDEVEFRNKAAAAEAVRASQGVLSSRARREQVLDKIEQANADVRNAETYVSYSTITAPFSGVISARHLDPGALAAPGAPILTLEDSRNYQLEATVEESQINRVHIGDRAPVLIDALAGRQLIGVVAEIGPAGDPSSRSFMVKLTLPESQGVLAGMFGRARFASGQIERLTVPSKALFERGQLMGVMVVDQSNRAWFRLVKTGKEFPNRVEVLSGLAPGERVIVHGADSLQDGARVAPAPSEAETKGTKGT